MRDDQSRLKATVILCLLAALIEGFDLQAAGVVAPGLKSDLGLSPSQLGLFFSATTIGLIVGALVGGRIADRLGRRMGLLVSLGLFGIFSLATGMAPSFTFLVSARFLTGVGLGGALPNLVAIAAESVSAQRRGAAVAVMFSGIPLGGALAGLFTLFGLHGADGWRTIFVFGGIAPLILLPVMAWGLPPLKVQKSYSTNTASKSATQALFGRTNILATLSLWVAFFFSLLILYLILNWLPSLLIGRGFSPQQAGLIQLVFNLVGAGASIFIGKAMDGAHAVQTVGLVYGLLIVALLCFAMLPTSLPLALGAAVILGPGLLGAQALLYGLSPKCYPDWARGTGVGASVAAGRVGSVAGPLLAGGLVASGRSSSEVLAVLIPIALTAAVAAIILTRRLGHKETSTASADTIDRKPVRERTVLEQA